MIIQISGKIGSGKDTVGRIIQYLTHCKNDNTSYSEWCTLKSYSMCDWRIVKYADALKDIICILTGCTREQLEDSDFKNSKLPDEWIRYGYADGFIKQYIGNGEMSGAIMNNKQCSKEEYEEHYRINWQTAYKSHLTYRELLQQLGTDLFRDKLHEDVWINALYSKYKESNYSTQDNVHPDYRIMAKTYRKYPNWIVTDCRFPNEADAGKARGGLNIRVNRPDHTKTLNNYFKDHLSETALDDYQFDEYIDNNGTIEELIEKVKEMVIRRGVI